MIDDKTVKFYEFLNGDISSLELKKFIYDHPDLEQQLNTSVYLDLIDFNFKDKHVSNKLRQLIFKYIIPEGQFEVWKLKLILHSFLKDPSNINNYLDRFYNLYLGTYQDNGQRKYQYKFLANLGLNYFYWTEEDYLKTTYGDKWKKEHENCSKEFEFYHKQLRPFADEILEALNSNKIQILNDGTYLITEDLKVKLEVEIIYTLEHPNKEYGS